MHMNTWPMDRAPAVNRQPSGARVHSSKPVWAAAWAILLPLLISSIACSALRKIAKPSIPAPPSWSSEGADTLHNGTGDLSQWRNRFQDPELSDLIVRTLKSNPSMRTARSLEVAEE